MAVELHMCVDVCRGRPLAMHEPVQRLSSISRVKCRVYWVPSHLLAFRLWHLCLMLLTFYSEIMQGLEVLLHVRRFPSRRHYLQPIKGKEEEREEGRREKRERGQERDLAAWPLVHTRLPTIFVFPKLPCSPRDGWPLPVRHRALVVLVVTGLRGGRLWTRNFWKVRNPLVPAWQAHISTFPNSCPLHSGSSAPGYTGKYSEQAWEHSCSCPSWPPSLWDCMRARQLTHL